MRTNGRLCLCFVDGATCGMHINNLSDTCDQRGVQVRVCAREVYTHLLRYQFSMFLMKAAALLSR